MAKLAASIYGYISQRVWVIKLFTHDGHLYDTVL